MMTDCIWSEVFDNNSRRILENGNAIIATISALLSAWFTVTIFFSNLKSDLSYRNLGFFASASFLRSTVHVLTYLLLPQYKERYTHENPCNFLGFWESFLSVYEVECLTHVCIERYVVAKYIVNGWDIQRNHYGLYQFLCVMFAAAYSTPPLLGIGKFASDFSCNNCILDMVLSDTWDSYVVVIIYLLRSIKSTGFMIMMLIWAHQREARFNSTKNYASVSKFTKNVTKIIILNLSLWLPITVIRGWVIFSSLTYNQLLQLVPTSFWIQWAMWTQSVSPALTALIMFYLDDTLRYKMKTIFFSSGSQTERKKDK
ncbi:uncharacterized protein LOC121729430 [Aricia agestis]|uniref:uncharacterized protein LOC121729430 n=1 Tax=Aricia agestis TaxID=91739 RepID=UPI001C2089B8|nr:uncharacterized protein LOC121729430 [Aricia agestis]